jgi:hypothetical protein
MEDVELTLKKLVYIATRKKYIPADSTVQTLKERVLQHKREQAAKSAVNMMTQMKQRLDNQTVAVRFTDLAQPCTERYPAANSLHSVSAGAFRAPRPAPQVFSTCRWATF